MKTLARWEAWLLHLSNLLVIGTGLVYGLMRYFMSPADEWAVVNHPFQPLMQHLHVLFAPLLVFAVGLIWRRHVVQHYRSGTPRRRRTGLATVLSAAPMAASGYLLQVAVEPGWRQAWIVVHVATSLFWTLGYLAHQLAPRTIETRESREALRVMPGERPTTRAYPRSGRSARPPVPGNRGTSSCP